MKLILIAGGKRSGKSHVMLCLAKLMSNAGLKVLAVDATKSADILNFLNISPSIENRFTLDGLPVITREGFDIIAAGTRFDPKLLANSMEERDFVLLEADGTPALPGDILYHTVFLQDMDIGNLYALMDLTQQIAKAHPEVPASFILNNYLHCKLSIKYICSTLGIQPEQFHIVPFDPKNNIHALNSRVDGRLKLKGFSHEHNQAIFNLFCELTGFENTRKAFKQLINLRRSQE